MMEYVIYPDALPLPQSNFSGSHSANTQTTQFTSGLVRRRQIGRVSVKKVNMEWLFTPEEYDIWEVFHRTELNNGCRKFTLNMSTGGPSQNGLHVVQCISDPSFSHEECNWRVSIECILYPYPQKDEGELLDVYLGGDSGLLMNTLKKYYTRGYM